MVEKRDPTPVFFVSVASKGLSPAVSLLFATLAGRSISVAAKGVKAIVGSDPDGVGAGLWAVSVGRRTGDGEWEIPRVCSGQVGVRPRKEFGDRRGWDSIYTGENSTRVSSC